MPNLVLFGILSIPAVILSWRTLFNIKSHGFYRFFSWECILWLLASNYRFWFVDPFSIRQIFSWILLLYSIFPVVAGILQLRKAGKPLPDRNDKLLYGFEKTTRLVDSGIYRYIRHPLYSSLIVLSWGIVLKNPTALLLFIAGLSTVFLYLTAIFDEKECMRYFGDPYQEYRKRSKMFVPFVV